MRNVVIFVLRFKFIVVKFSSERRSVSIFIDWTLERVVVNDILWKKKKKIELTSLLFFRRIFESLKNFVSDASIRSLSFLPD